MSPKSNAERQKKYRERLKQDPIKYETKRKAHLERVKLNKIKNSDQNKCQKERTRQQWREYSRRYYEKKKGISVDETKTTDLIILNKNAKIWKLRAKKLKAICPPAPESLLNKPKLPFASGQDPLSEVSEITKNMGRKNKAKTYGYSKRKISILANNLKLAREAKKKKILSNSANSKALNCTDAILQNQFASGQDPPSEVSEEPCASTLQLLSEIPLGAVIIARVYKYLQKEYEELKARSGDAPALSSLGDILGRTAAATGLSRRAVSAVLEVDALKPYQGKHEAKPEVARPQAFQKRKRPKYICEDDVGPIEEESDDDDGDSASQEEPCEEDNGEDGLIETLKVEYYEDDDYDEYAQTNAGEQISRLQDFGSSEVSSAIQILIASTVSRTQDGEVTKSATCSSSDPITATPHAVKEEIPDDEYCMSEPQVFARTYSRHDTPGKPRVEVRVELIDEHSHTQPSDNATDAT